MIRAMFSEALVSLTGHKLRSFLTTLGIVIGVAAVVMMVAAGQAVENYIGASLSSLGNNLLVVLPGAPSTGPVRGGLGGKVTLVRQDADAIAALPGVMAVAPQVNGSAQLVYGPNNWNTGIVGITPAYLSVANWTVARGVPLEDRDVRTAARVVLIGTEVENALFTGQDPLGKSIRIKNVPFTVIGVLGSKGQSLDGRNQDDTVMMPLTTARQRVAGSKFADSVNSISVQAATREGMDVVQSQIEDLLHVRHRIRPGMEDDFNVRNLTSLANTVNEIGTALSILLATIASISLVVGSIGIMNMMLVSVTERTREIGIRKALGAPDASITTQFLLEAILISFLGSFTGMVLGIVLAQGGGMILHKDVPLSWWPVALSIAVAGVVGIASGLFPAIKATRLDPVEALRYQ